MKYISYILALILLYACGTNTEDNGQAKFSNLDFSIDTVMVDPGNEIINLKTGLWISAVDPSATYLYNWDQDNTVLEKINLDKLVLEEKLPFEKEGPNGVGAYVSWISLTDDGHVIFSNFEDMGLFDFKGEKIRTYKLRNENFEGDTLKEDETFTRRSIITNSGKDIYGILGSWSGSSFSLAKMEYPVKKLKKYSLPEYDRLADYTVILKSSDMMMIKAADQFNDQFDDRIIFSNSIFSSLMVYDLALDSLYKVDYPITLTKNSKTGKYRNEVESREEFQKVMSEMNQEINFNKPLWDSKNQRFYRFSYLTKSQETLEDGTKKTKSDIYLTILDKDFNVLGETKVKELNSPPSTHFVKDGKIWIFSNVDDELAFVRLSII